MPGILQLVVPALGIRQHQLRHGTSRPVSRHQEGELGNTIAHPAALWERLRRLAPARSRQLLVVKGVEEPFVVNGAEVLPSLVGAASSRAATLLLVLHTLASLVDDALVRRHGSARQLARGCRGFDSWAVRPLGLLTRGGAVNPAVVDRHLDRRSQAKPDRGVGGGVVLGADVFGRHGGGARRGVEGCDEGGAIGSRRAERNVN